jgi:alanine racemase
MEHFATGILRATRVQIDLDALGFNFKSLSHHAAPAEVMCVVKANAYGHGLVECAKYLESVGAKYFGVALLQEGIELRQAGILAPIHVFSGILEDEIEYFIKYDLDLTASSVAKMKAIARIAQKLRKTARVQLKLDTGLGRIGTRTKSVESLYQEALDAEYCTLSGVFSHLVQAEAEDCRFTELQLRRFEDSMSFFQRRGLEPPVQHIGNSAATLALKECHLDMVRPGLALYGIYPARHLEQSGVTLKPVLSLKSRVVFFKAVEAGAGVSYGHTWIAERMTRVVTLPIGYGDGYLRGLSNRSSVLIRGKRHPVIGNICMDQMMVDIGQDEAFNGEEVVLIGTQAAEHIGVAELAAAGQTVSQEILTSLNARVPRIYLSSERADGEQKRSIA